MLYVTFQIATGGIVLAAFFFATETTSRPVTTGGQFIFGTGCGILAMFLKMFTELPIPAYLAVLAMNTLTPLIDAVWRPRVLGQPHFAWLRVRIGR
jgi:electron transport complex protein RnfD